LIKNENEEVDAVSTGLAVITIGLLIILLAPSLSNFSYTPSETTVYEDKTTRMPNHIEISVFVTLGGFIVMIGCAIFLKSFINATVDTL
jgi:multisubunit Na+/H+ antiporter MnhB subunit